MGEESIFESVKNLLGVQEEDTSFDQDILIHLNTVLSICTQIGVGPDEGFIVTDNSQTWNDFVRDSAKLSAVKSYVYLRVRRLFDPPLSSSVASANDDAIAELEWRLNSTVEYDQGENSK